MASMRMSSSQETSSSALRPPSAAEEIQEVLIGGKSFSFFNLLFLMA